MKEFNAYVVNQEGDSFTGGIETRQISDLPDGDILVRVHFSSLNYKDALSATGNKGVTRTFPHTPGIDAVGTVEKSDRGPFHTGAKVIVTSYDLGMNTPGGFGKYIRVPSEWAVRLPKHLTMKEAMIYGTAGLTSGLSVLKLSERVKPEDGSILVSGATGGVGSLAVSILNKLGYSVTAITGKDSEKNFLLKLGASEVISRADFENMDKKPLLKPQYAGAIDTVGGVILENILKTVKPQGAITCCGNVASPKLETTVFPFILRGVSLIGIDSQNCPHSLRKTVWEKLAKKWKPESLSDVVDEISLEKVPEKIPLILQGKLKGRTIINQDL